MLVAIVSVPTVSQAVASTSQAIAPSPASLPAPYNQWGVQLKPSADNPRVLTLTFNSALLGHQVTNTVYLPSIYHVGGDKLPVLYYLHGTVVAPIDNRALDPVTQNESLLYMISGGGGYRQTQLSDFPSQLDRAHFIVVAPDTDPDYSWCETCAWINGRNDLLPNVHPVTAETVPADSFLHDELYPLIETLFDTRTDRGGRGVIGFSMGGWSALLQGMIHPDDYAYVGSISGVYETLYEPEIRVVLEALGYMRDQGYGVTPETDGIWWRNFDPSQVATNIRGVNTKLFLSSGDACLKLTDLAAPDCIKYSPITNPVAMAIEEMLMRNYAIAVQSLSSKGIAAQSVQLPGIHGANNHRVYSDYIVGSANQTFASEVDTPETYSYRTVLPEFSVWGYHVRIHRPNDEFLSLSSCRTDGRSCTVTGSGGAEIVTPATFSPGQTYTVTTTSDNGEKSARPVTADSKGKLHLAIDLGTGHLLDENVLINQLGIQQKHTTTVHISD